MKKQGQTIGDCPSFAQIRELFALPHKIYMDRVTFFGNGHSLTISRFCFENLKHQHLLHDYYKIDLLSHYKLVFVKKSQLEIY